MSNSSEKISYEELLERVKSLEQDNDVLASRAEEILLLSLLGNNISTINAERELIDELLENASILLNIPYCLFFSKNKNMYELVSYYDAVNHTYNYDDKMCISDGIYEELNLSGIYFEKIIKIESQLKYKFPIEVTEYTEVLFLPFESMWITRGLLMFVVDGENLSLASRIMLLQQAERLVIDKIDKLSYIKKIEQLNVNLEHRVKERTLELQDSNRKLIKEISERNEIQKELVKARDRAQEADRLKSVFLANMSHEIRTPMNAVVGFSEVLESGVCNTDEMQRYSKLIHSNSMMLLNLINDLLDFSKIEANQMEIKMRTCNINKILDEVFAMGLSFKQQLYRDKITLKIIKGEKDIKSNFITDEHRLKQILINLVSNAIKFSKKGFVIVQYSVMQNNILFSVSDEGIGIDESMHEAIFNRFTRVGNDKSKSILGNGLGLTITRNLVEMLGGEISVESEEGKGSVFVFNIPKKVEHVSMVGG